MLKGQGDVGQQVLDRTQEASDRVALCGLSEILGGDVEIDLRACDESMTEQVSNRDEAYARANEVGGEGMA